MSPKPPTNDAPTIELADVEVLLHRLYIAGGEGGDVAKLRVEDKKKARELAALLTEISRVGRRDLVVDAAAGHAYAGLCAVELLGKIERLVVIERDEKRAAKSLEAAGRLDSLKSRVEVRVGDVSAAENWPERPDAVIALHACGGATDAILDAAASAEARWMLVVPCCYARGLPVATIASDRADAIGLPRQAEIRRRFIESFVDAERALRLESAGYEVKVVAFVPPTVTGHNLLFRARRAYEAKRMSEAAARREKLLAG